jgi:hypothetical protein
MPGGRVYLINIAASFEFFSLRYVPNYSPLFTLIPTPEEIVQCSNVKHLACYKKINGVKKYAMDCIGILRNGEDCIRLRIGNDANGYYHYTRIINQHKSYIEKFETYIRDKYCVNNLLDKAIRDKYVDLCDEIYKIRSEYSSLQTKMIARG